MGIIIEDFCCVDNNDIINNPNYPQTSNDKFIDVKYQTFRKLENEKLPSSLIKLDSSKIIDSSIFESTSEIKVASKDVIVGKETHPFYDYKILSELGSGTFGKVYKVKNIHNNSIRAMKKISKYMLGPLKNNEVTKEIKILQNICHPNIIKLYEYYLTNEYIYLINELSEEGDLLGKFKKLRKFPEFIVKIIMLQIFKALIYLNEKSIIHGDLKLENILVVCYAEDEKNRNNKGQDGFIEAIKHDMKIINGNINSLSTINTLNSFDLKEINNFNKKLYERQQREDIKSVGTSFRFRGKNEDKDQNKTMINNQDNKSENIYDLKQLDIFNYGIKLIDFGCSKIFTRTKKKFHDIIGTLVYCSPEVLSNNYNEKCDIWSCGVLMYLLLSGHFPFDGKNEEEIMSKILSGKFEFDIDYFNGISDEAKDLISKCLKYETKKRITIQKALNHRFFDDLKQSNKYTEEDKQKLNELKKANNYSKFYQIVLTYLAYNFSDNKLLNELSQLYDKIDKNSDYKLTKAEIYKAYKEAGIPITQEELELIISSIDFDKNGSVDYEEFIRMCIPKEKLFTEDNLENAFLLFDKDKKGFITPNEIINFIQSNNKNVKPKVIQQIKNEILEFADEIIDLEDFKILMIANSEK